MGYSSENLRLLQVSRLHMTLSANFTTPLHVCLNFDNVSMPTKIKRDDVRALMARLKTRIGHNVRYVSIPEYAENGQDIKAYHFIMDEDAEAVERVCHRWYDGEWTINRVDLTQPAALPSFMYNPASAKGKRRFYNTSNFIFEHASA